MKTEFAPLDVAAAIGEPINMILIGIFFAVVLAILLGSRHETAVLAVAAGLVGVILAF